MSQSWCILTCPDCIISTCFVMSKDTIFCAFLDPRLFYSINGFEDPSFADLAFIFINLIFFNLLLPPAWPPSPSALSVTILWGMHQSIPNVLTFPNSICTFIWQSNFLLFYKKITIKKNFRPKKEIFFDENDQNQFSLTNMGIFSHKYGHFLFKYVISMLWEIVWGPLHICRSKIGDVKNVFHIHQIFESLQPRGRSWRGYATQEADQELKWMLRTLSVWES